jgi:hypothetical protein
LYELGRAEFSERRSRQTRKAVLQQSIFFETTRLQVESFSLQSKQQEFVGELAAVLPLQSSNIYTGRSEMLKVLQAFTNGSMQGQLKEMCKQLGERWSRKFGPIVKVYRMTKELIQNEETKEPFA